MNTYRVNKMFLSFYVNEYMYILIENIELLKYRTTRNIKLNI